MKRSDVTESSYPPFISSPLSHICVPSPRFQAPIMPSSPHHLALGEKKLVRLLMPVLSTFSNFFWAVVALPCVIEPI